MVVVVSMFSLGNDTARVNEWREQHRGTLTDEQENNMQEY
jgi:hypothetical protein